MADDGCCEVVVTADDPDWPAGCTRTLYDVACVLALPVTGGNPEHLAWVRAGTRDG